MYVSGRNTLVTLLTGYIQLIQQNNNSLLPQTFKNITKYISLGSSCGSKKKIYSSQIIIFSVCATAAKPYRLNPHRICSTLFFFLYKAKVKRLDRTCWTPWAYSTLAFFGEFSSIVFQEKKKRPILVIFSVAYKDSITLFQRTRKTNFNCKHLQHLK